MSKIQEYLEKIRLARYGKDVRQAIHDAIHQCYEDGKVGSIDLVARESISALQEELNQKTELLEITKSTATTLQNTKPGGYRLLEIQGNTIQNGTPSPSNRVPMLSYGESVNIMSGLYQVNKNGVYASNDGYICNQNSIPCKSGDIIGIVTSQSAWKYVLFYNENGFISSVDLGTTNTSATAPSGATYFNFDVAGTLNTVGKITLTINGKYVVPIKTHWKNFANPTRNIFVSRLGGVIASKTGFDYVATASGTAQVVNMYIPIKENTDYAFSFKDKGYINSFGLTFVDSIGAWTNITNKVKSGNSGVHKYALLSWQLDAGYSGTISVYDVQLEVGAETDFEEYRETIAYILTNEPPRKGDFFYKEGGLWKLEHRMAEFGLENCSGCGFNTLYNDTITFYLVVPNAVKSTAENLFCDMLTNTKLAEVETYKISIGENSYAWINIPQSEVETLDTAGCWKWVVAKAPKIIYQKATPTIEVLDTASQIALNDLETYEGVTYVEFDTRVPPLGIKGEVGTSQVGAYTLKSLLNSESNAIRYEKLNTMILSLGGNV